jgi:hypothetical protein
MRMPLACERHQGQQEDRHAVNDTLRRFDLPAVTQRQVSDWIGQGTRELLIQALASSGKTH